MAKRTDRIGERFTTNEGCEIVIVEYNRADNLWVEFQDKYRARVHTNYQACQKGEVKNPYHPCVYGVGCLGLMSDGNKPIVKVNGKSTRECELWRGMLQRCYSDKFHEKNPTYRDCEVAERWLVFANFLEDLPSVDGFELWRDNPNQRIALDKDSKVEGNKVYSLDTCCFISNVDNVKERLNRCGLPNQPKKIMAVSLTKNKVIVFQSMKQAEKLGFNHSAISECCNDKRKSHKGYKWKII